MNGGQQNHEVTIGELSRNLRDFREDSSKQMGGIRTDMQMAISKLENAVHDVRTAVAEAPYVDQTLWEEVRKSQGERIGESERDIVEIKGTLTKVNQLAWGAVISVMVTVVGGGTLAVITLVLQK